MSQQNQPKGKAKISLHPLTFDEVMTDLLKIKPESKARRGKKKRPKTPKAKRAI
jgi:hypothetical protein